MAQADPFINETGLRLTTGTRADIELDPDASPEHDLDMQRSSEQPLLKRPPFRGSATSEETIRATSTPPIDIPDAGDSGKALLDEPSAGPSYMDEYMRNRHPSVSFDEEIKLDSGHRQSMREPLERPAKDGSRGRSLLQAMAEQSKAARAHSESERSRYDQQTGRHLPQYSSSPPRELARFGEGRFPLLQSTVDAMAQESNPQPTALNSHSLTSGSTVSPDASALLTPSDEGPFINSPSTAASPFSTGQAFSYEEVRKPYRRTASQRWRDGEFSSSPQDFFTRASGSLRNKSLRSSRRDTSDSARSPRSAASSFLRGFSISSSTDNGGADGPPAVDSEGQTIGEDYVLGKQIGYGGFSVIKEVTQLSPSGSQRKLAVKIVRRQIPNKSEAENDAAQAEFEHEVELWRFLSHKHILPLEAVYKLDEATFCFIPLNTGGTLFDLVRSNRSGLEAETARSYSHQLASALRYLHLDARVVHRDVKLENCLIESPHGHPGLLRLCDFGMAEWLSNDNSPDMNASERPPRKHFGPADSSTSAFAGGSLEYAAPEILKIATQGDGDIDEATVIERSIVSPAVDMWAYGVCVYSLLVGSRPFQNSFQPRVVMAILSGKWNRELLRQNAGDEAADLVEGCLEMDDQLRWDVQRVLTCDWLEGIESDDATSLSGSGWRL